MNYNFISYKTEQECIASVNLKFTNRESETLGKNRLESVAYVIAKEGNSVIWQVAVKCLHVLGTVVGSGDRDVKEADAMWHSQHSMKYTADSEWRWGDSVAGF